MRCHPKTIRNLLCRKRCHMSLPPCRDPPRWLACRGRQLLRCLKESMRWTTLWTLGSVQVLRHKVGRPTFARQWCRFRAISNWGHKQRGPFLHSALIASRLQVAMSPLNRVSSLLPDVLGRLPHLWASFLVTLFARTPAGTVDVNHVMSGLNMMITPATVASNAFYILVVCLVPPGSPRLRQGVSPGAPNAPLNVALYVDYMSSMSVWTASILWSFPPPGGVEIPGPRLNDEYGMQSMSGGLPNRHRYYLALLDTGLQWLWSLYLVGGWLLWALLAGEEVLKGVRLSHPCFALPWGWDFSFLCWLVGVFCLVVCFVFCLGLLFWFCFWFRIVSFPSLHTKAVEFFRSQWKGTGLIPGLMSWCAEYLYVSLTWTAGILEICCSLRGKKNG